MTKRVIEHEIKLEKSVKIILAALAFGALVHAFVPIFSVGSALAEARRFPIEKGPLSVTVSGPVLLSGSIRCDGCSTDTR